MSTSLKVIAHRRQVLNTYNASGAGKKKPQAPKETFYLVGTGGGVRDFMCCVYDKFSDNFSG